MSLSLAVSSDEASKASARLFKVSLSYSSSSPCCRRLLIGAASAGSGGSADLHWLTLTLRLGSDPLSNASATFRMAVGANWAPNQIESELKKSKDLLALCRALDESAYRQTTSSPESEAEGEMGAQIASLLKSDGCSTCSIGALAILSEHKLARLSLTA